MNHHLNSFCHLRIEARTLEFIDFSCEALIQGKEFLSKMILAGKLSRKTWDILQGKMTRKEMAIRIDGKKEAHVECQELGVLYDNARRRVYT